MPGILLPVIIMICYYKRLRMEYGASGVLPGACRGSIGSLPVMISGRLSLSGKIRRAGGMREILRNKKDAQKRIPGVLFRLLFILCILNHLNQIFPLLIPVLLALIRPAIIHMQGVCLHHCRIIIVIFHINLYFLHC